MRKDPVGKAIAEIEGQHSGLTSQPHQIRNRDEHRHNCGSLPASRNNENIDNRIGNQHSRPPQQRGKPVQNRSAAVNNGVQNQRLIQNHANTAGKPQYQSCGQHPLGSSHKDPDCLIGIELTNNRKNHAHAQIDLHMNSIAPVQAKAAIDDQAQA